MIDTSTARPLKIENANNKFNCEYFTEIHFAPNKEPKLQDYDKIFVIKNGEESIFVQLVDFIKMKVNYISSVHTLPATGLESIDWFKMWHKKFPELTLDTYIAVYCYKRLKD